jgi:hypothetical protein
MVNMRLKAQQQGKKQNMRMPAHTRVMGSVHNSGSVAA